MNPIFLNDLVQSLLAPLSIGAIINQEGKILNLKPQNPTDLGLLPLIAQNIWRYFPLQAGDMFLVNEPATGARRDRLSLLSAINIGEELWYVVSAKPFQTTMRIPPTPVAQNFVVNRDLLLSIIGQSENPKEMLENIECQVSYITQINSTVGLLSTAKPHVFSKSTQNKLLEQTYQLTQKFFQEIPHAEGRSDLKLELGQSLSLKTSFDEGTLLFDFAGTPNSKLIGLSTASAFGACASSVLKFLAQPLPLNSGFLECISVTTPSQSWFNIKLQEQKPEQLDPLCDTIATLSYNSLKNLFRGNSNQLSYQGRVSLKFRFNSGKLLKLELYSGLSANSLGSGLDCAHEWQCGSDLLSVEEIENHYPIIPLELQTHKGGSGGRGQHIGGRGMIGKFKLLETTEISWEFGFGSRQVPGLSGASGGLNHEILIFDENKKEDHLDYSPAGSITLKKDQVFSVVTSTGAGWGKLI